MVINKSLRWTKELMATLDVLHGFRMNRQGKLGQNVIIWHLKGYSQVTRGVCVFQTESERRCWKSVLVMLTEKDLLLFDSMPCMREHWLSPTHTYPLLATRYTHRVTALILLVHTNTHLKKQSRYTHLHSRLFNMCLFTHTCKHAHFLHASWQCWPNGN